jgi:hypothetical protein
LVITVGVRVALRIGSELEEDLFQAGSIGGAQLADRYSGREGDRSHVARVGLC